MNKRVMHWVVAVAATALLAAGCGSDEKSSSGTGGAASSEAEAWCDDLLGVAGKVAAASSDPSKAKDMKSLAADAARLTAEGAAIVGKHSGDAAYVADCERQAGALVSGSGAPDDTTASDDTVTDDTTATDDTASDDTASDDTVTDVTVTDDTVTDDTVGSGTASVADAKEWCKKIEELADVIKQIKADPSKALELAQKMADATKFLQDGTRIASASEANAKIISECSDKVSKEIQGS